MMRYIYTEENEHIYLYGRHEEFENEEDFTADAKAWYEDLSRNTCELVDVKLEYCIHSDVAIAAKELVPMTSRNISIRKWYTARVNILSYYFDE